MHILREALPAFPRLTLRERARGTAGGAGVKLIRVRPRIVECIRMGARPALRSLRGRCVIALKSRPALLRDARWTLPAS